MKFTETHEWIDLTGTTGLVGITDHAQRELGDIVFVELPKKGKKVKIGDPIAVLESTKAAADVYAPVSGTIVEVNENLQTSPEKVNQSAEKEGWILKLQIDDAAELNQLMDLSTYQAKMKK